MTKSLSWDDSLFMNDLTPFFFQNFVFVKVWSWISSWTSKEKDRVSISNQNMRVSWWRSLWGVDDFCPKLSFKIVLKEIIQLFWSIMSSKYIHWVFVNNRIGSITSFWPGLNIILSKISPFISFKSKFKQIVLILSVIAPKNIHWLIINNSRVTMSRTWRITSSRE